MLAYCAKYLLLFLKIFKNIEIPLFFFFCNQFRSINFVNVVKDDFHCLTGIFVYVAILICVFASAGVAVYFHFLSILGSLFINVVVKIELYVTQLYLILANR